MSVCWLIADDVLKCVFFCVNVKCFESYVAFSGLCLFVSKSNQLNYRGSSKIVQKEEEEEGRPEISKSRSKRKNKLKITNAHFIEHRFKEKTTICRAWTIPWVSSGDT